MTSVQWAWTVIGVPVVGALCWFASQTLPGLVRDMLARRADAKRTSTREDDPHRMRIISALESHVSALHRGLYGGQFSTDEWQHWHDDLGDLVESHDGARALGSTYPAFSATLKDDQKSIKIERMLQAEAVNVVFPEGSDAAGREKHRRWAQSIENRATTLGQFADLMAALGHADAEKYARYAKTHGTQSEQMLKAYTSEMHRLADNPDA